MKRHFHHSTGPGFTLIEILIVLTIVGFILAIVFLLVPAVQRSSRNYTRRHAAQIVLTALFEYRSNNGHFPATAPERTDFIDNYATGISSDAFYINFQGVGGGHHYFPELDTIAIQYAHWCNRYGDGDSPDDPVAGTDVNQTYMAVWTQTEPALDTNQSTYCIDNHDHT